MRARKVVGASGRRPRGRSGALEFSAAGHRQPTCPGRADSVPRRLKSARIQLRTTASLARPPSPFVVARQSDISPEIAALLDGGDFLPAGLQHYRDPARTQHMHRMAGLALPDDPSPSPKVCATVAEARSARCASDSVENRSTFERTRSAALLGCRIRRRPIARVFDLDRIRDLDSRRATRSESPPELDPSGPDHCS